MIQDDDGLACMGHSVSCGLAIAGVRGLSKQKKRACHRMRERRKDQGLQLGDGGVPAWVDGPTSTSGGKLNEAERHKARDYEIASLKRRAESGF